MATSDDNTPMPKAVAAKMIGNCGLSQNLNMRMISAGVDCAVVEMTLDAHHLNGFGIAHGGAIFALADTTFAHACNSDNIVTVAQLCQVNFLRPGQAGDTLRATASHRASGGRTGLYDVTIANQDGEIIAEFRGMSRKLQDSIL